MIPSLEMQKLGMSVQEVEKLAFYSEDPLVRRRYQGLVKRIKADNMTLRIPGYWDLVMYPKIQHITVIGSDDCNTYEFVRHIMEYYRKRVPDFKLETMRTPLKDQYKKDHLMMPNRMAGSMAAWWDIKERHGKSHIELPIYKNFSSKENADRQVVEKLIIHAELLVAIWDGRCELTKYAIDLMRYISRPVHVYFWRTPPEVITMRQDEVERWWFRFWAQRVTPEWTEESLVPLSNGVIHTKNNGERELRGAAPYPITQDERWYRSGDFPL